MSYRFLVRQQDVCDSLRHAEWFRHSSSILVVQISSLVFVTMADASYQDDDNDDDDVTHDPRTLGADQLLGLFVPPPDVTPRLTPRQQESADAITPLATDDDYTAPTPHVRTSRPIYRSQIKETENDDGEEPRLPGVQRDRSASLADLFMPLDRRDESTALLSSSAADPYNHRLPGHGQNQTYTAAASSYYHAAADHTTNNLLDDSTSSANFFLHDQMPSFPRTNQRLNQRMTTPRDEDTAPSRWRKLQVRLHFYPSTFAGATSTYGLLCVCVLNEWRDGGTNVT